jgi:predicted DNA-binding transcriptional regulator YafY
MAKQQYLERYMLIIKKVRKGLCTLKEIEDYLDEHSELSETDLRISKRTFQRDCNEIRSLYDIDIAYDFSRKGYRIDEEGANQTNIRMMEAFDLFNVLKMSEQLSEFILFEERKALGSDYFYPVLQAIKVKQLIQIHYQKYWEEEIVERNLQPYALKEFKGRWYILAVDEYDNRLKTFGLDRIQDLTTSKKTFLPRSDNNIQEKFKDCFGIISGEELDLEEVILSFTSQQAKYIKSYPLHHSQEVISENETEVVIKFHIKITYDFEMELLSFGDSLKVIRPSQLKKKMVRYYKNALENNTL